VIASRFLLSVSGSISLTKNLYRSMLVDNIPVEGAVMFARRSLSHDATKLDWLSLQLYERKHDGCESYPLKQPRTEPAKMMDPPVVANESQTDLISRIDYDNIGMDELLELRDRAVEALLTRFERKMALVSIDLSQSAANLVRLARESDPSLIRQCRELIERHISEHQGRIFAAPQTRIDLCFPSVQNALDAMDSFYGAVMERNYQAKREDLIVMRIGLHHGSTLTDGNRVAGDTVDVTARIAEAMTGSDVWLSQEALAHTSNIVRAGCQPVEDNDIIATDKRLALFSLELCSGDIRPESVSIENTKQDIALPRQDIISFGRLDKLPDGTPANDICLTLPDRKAQMAISRWHFELRRSRQDGYVIRVLSGQATDVDGKRVQRGGEVPLQKDSVVQLAGVVTITFKSLVQDSSTRAAMTYYG